MQRSTSILDLSLIFLPHFIEVSLIFFLFFFLGILSRHCAKASTVSTVVTFEMAAESKSSSTTESSSALKVSKIGILGTGDVGCALTRGFICEGYSVLMGTRKASEDKRKDLIAKITTQGVDKEENAAVAKILNSDEASSSSSSSKEKKFVLDTFNKVACNADLLVLAVSWAAVDAVIATIKEHVKSKVLIDATNPIKVGGDPPRALGLFEMKDSSCKSAGEYVQKQLGSECKVVKCFNIINWKFMTNGTRYFKEPKPLMYVSGNDQQSKQWVLDLVTKWNFDAHDLGGIETSHYSEVGCYLWVHHMFANGKFNTEHALALPRNW